MTILGLTMELVIHEEYYNLGNERIEGYGKKNTD